MPETTWDGKPVAAEPPFGASIVVFRRGIAGVEVLLLHRAHHGPDYSGDWAWTPPAGCRLPGEPVDTCAARELYEEAGLVLPMRRLDDRTASWARYVAEAPADARVQLHDTEHDTYLWTRPAEALARLRPAAVRETVEQVLATVGGGTPT